eukprot:2362880-Prymnesium_polylepis.1
MSATRWDERARRCMRAPRLAVRKRRAVGGVRGASTDESAAPRPRRNRVVCVHAMNGADGCQGPHSTC